MNDPDKNAANEGIRKAAILVCSLEAADADSILDELGPNQAAQLRGAMVELGQIDPQEQRRVIDEFFRAGATPTPGEPVGIDLEKGTPRNPSPPSEGALPFGFLQETEDERLAGVLAGERPQTIALILSHLSPDQAGRVLGQLDPALQADIIHRLVDLEQTDPETLREVEEALQARLSQYPGVRPHRNVGMKAVSGILEAAGDGLGSQILVHLAAHDQVLAEELRRPEIRFDDLSQLDDASLAAVFRASEPEVMMTALVGAPPQLIDRIVRQLPSREGKIVRRQLEHPGPIRLSDVEEARRRVAEHARRLATEGRITLAADCHSPVFVSTYS